MLVEHREFLKRINLARGSDVDKKTPRWDVVTTTEEG